MNWAEIEKIASLSERAIAARHRAKHRDFYAVDMKDPVTRNHANRVLSKLCAPLKRAGVLPHMSDEEIIHRLNKVEEADGRPC